MDINKEELEVKEMEVEKDNDVEENNDGFVAPGDDTMDANEVPADHEEDNGDIVDPGSDTGILEPEEMIGDRNLTDPNGIAPQPGQNVDKQLGGNTVGLMDVLARKAEQGIKGDASKELDIDQEVEGIIASINEAMGIAHEPDNSNKNPDNPYAEKIGGTDIAATGSNPAADALNQRLDQQAKVEYSASGEPKNLGDYMKEQKGMQDGGDLYGSNENETEIINDKVDVQASTYKSDYGNGVDEVCDGDPTGRVEGDNIPEFSSGEGDAENRKFEASELKATEDEEEDFAPSDEDDHEEEFEEEEDDDFEDDENGEGAKPSDNDDFEDDENFDDNGETGAIGGGEITATVAPGADKEITSLADLENRDTVSGTIEKNPDLYKDENQEITAVNTDGASGDGMTPGHNGNDMVDTNKYEDQGTVDGEQTLAQVVGTTDGKYDDGMNNGDGTEPGTDYDAETKYDVNVPYGLGGGSSNGGSSDDGIGELGDGEGYDENDDFDNDDSVPGKDNFEEGGDNFKDDNIEEKISEESVTPFGWL